MTRRLLRYAAMVLFMALVLAALAALLYTDFGRRLPPVLLPSAPAGQNATPQPALPAEDAAPMHVPTSDAPPPDTASLGAGAETDGPVLSAVLGLLPDEDDALLGVAVELINMRVKAGELDEAIRLSRDLLRNEPGNAVIRLRLAALYSLTGQANDAYREADTILAATPDSSAANLLAADIAMRCGLPSLAVKHARVAAAAEERSVEAARMLAQALAAEGSVQEALRRLEALASILPDDVELLVQLGSLYVGAGDRSQAAVALNKAAEIDPENAAPHIALAQLDLTGGDLPAAVAKYRAILERTPNHPIVLNNLAAILSEQGGDKDEALAMAQRAWQLAPDAPNVADTLGWLHVLRKEYDQALPYLNVAVRRMPREPEVRYHYGALLYAKGLTRQAEEHLAAALAMGREFTGSANARRLLESVRDNKPFEP